MGGIVGLGTSAQGKRCPYCVLRINNVQYMLYTLYVGFITTTVQRSSSLHLCSKDKNYIQLDELWVALAVHFLILFLCYLIYILDSPCGVARKMV